MFELLNLWSQYVEVVYMPEGQVHIMDQVAQMEGRMDDLSYVKLMERDNQEKRLKMLFKDDDDEDGEGDKEADFDEDQAMKEAYETVNEGETTDTTSGLDGESLEARAIGLTTKQTESQQPASTSNSGSKVVEEGIKSSDEEGDEGAAQPDLEAAATAEQVQDKVNEAPTVKASSSTKPDRHVNLDLNVTSMKPDEGSALIGSDDKDKIEFNYGFSG